MAVARCKMSLAHSQKNVFSACADFEEVVSWHKNTPFSLLYHGELHRVKSILEFILHINSSANIQDPQIADACPRQFPEEAEPWQ
jgi:hypothetical protein